MPSPDIAAAAARHCIRVGMGLTTCEAVMRWADELILSEPGVSARVIALASAFAAPAWVVIDHLKALTTREALVIALREAAGEVCASHERGETPLREGVDRLVGWSNALELGTDPNYEDMWSAFDMAAELLDMSDEGVLRYEEVEQRAVDHLRGTVTSKRPPPQGS